MKVGTAVLLSIVPFAVLADGGSKRLEADLIGYNEPPAVSTTANGEFDARLDSDARQITYKLSYGDFELGSVVTQAHIHLGQRGVNGGISVFLCSNLGNGPAGTQACPPFPATVTGTIRPVDVIGPTGQGITAGEFDELVRAIRAGVTYVNVHSVRFPGGEIRDQIRSDRGRHHH